MFGNFPSYNYTKHPFNDIFDVDHLYNNYLIYKLLLHNFSTQQKKKNYVMPASNSNNQVGFVIIKF